jgi:copper chaperone CopZ
MTCAACEDHIKHEVNKLAGIVKLDVSYTNKNALVTFDTIKTSKQAIEEAVKNSGYLVTEAKLK